MTSVSRTCPKRLRELSPIWTEDTWANEGEFILTHSTVATEKTLQRRREIIESREEGPVLPLHEMPNFGLSILSQVEDGPKPGKYIYLGLDGDMAPMARMSSRAHAEWFWLRGRRENASRPSIPWAVGSAVIARDWPICQLCFGEVALGEHHIDHIIPYSMGGGEAVSNLRLSHDLCNMRRGVGRNDG